MKKQFFKKSIIIDRCIGYLEEFASPACAAMPVIFILSSLFFATGCGGSENEPPHLKYKGSPFSLFTGVVMEPAVPQGYSDASSYSSFPAFPEGISLDSKTGIISGAPVRALSSTRFEITANGPFGIVRSAVTISVSGPPKNLTYPDSPFNFWLNRDLSNVFPKLEGEATLFEVTPALPSSLSIDIKTGEILGTPKSLVTNSSFEVTASNPVGKASTNIILSISGAPGGLSYGGPTFVYKAGFEIEPLVPTYSGKVSEFAVYPALPCGLVISKISGIIEGLPICLQDPESYTITASNPVGQSSAQISIEVICPYQ